MNRIFPERSLQSPGPTPLSPVEKRALTPRAPSHANRLHIAIIYSSGKPFSESG